MPVVPAFEQKFNSFFICPLEERKHMIVKIRRIGFWMVFRNWINED
jgi:hypothetical protein